MSNQWLNNLRSRMEDHEEDVPERLWDDIRNELFSEEEENNVIAAFAPETGNKKEEARPEVRQRSLYYRIGGIAAAAVVLFLLIKMFPQAEDHTMLSKKTDFQRKDRISPSSENIKEPFNKAIENVSTGFSSAQDKAGNNIHEWLSKEDLIKTAEAPELKHKNILEIPAISAITMPLHQETVLIPETALADRINIDVTQIKETDEVAFKQQKQQEKYADHTKSGSVASKSKRFWMLSMLTGNASPNAAEQQFPGYASISGRPMSMEEVWSASNHEEDPMTAILLANQNQPVEARIRHKIPVTLGLSLYYNLGKKWGIGTGLNYTKLASELHSGSGANYIKGDQVLHYVGIPVQVNYNVIRKGKFTGYVTGGALVEKPVSGSLTTNYIVDHEIKETVKERLDNKPLQFSVNTAAGLQLKVIDKIGVYAEPGIGYHFRDDSSPNTIYKEKPLHFNVKFGIRLLLD